MKKLIAILLCALMLVTAAACAKDPEPSPAPVGEPDEPTPENNEPETVPDPGVLVGGWQIAEDTSLTDELRAIFQKGLEELVGVNYTPIALLGTQVVAGTNYCFLTQGTVVYPDAAPMFMLIYLYEDLEGAVSVLSIEAVPIVAEDDGTLSVPEAETLSGGWSYAESPEVTDEMKARLDKALEGLTGAAYEPIANLGTQVVAGLNRCLLCKVSPVVPNPVAHYALVYVYEDLEGGATLNNVVDFNLGISEAEPEPEVLSDIEWSEAGEDEAFGMAGGWEVSGEPDLTDEYKAIFAQAFEMLVGVDYEPVALLGTQIVSGTNYCFLAKATVVYPNALPKYVLVYIYEDLFGSAVLMNIADMPVIPNEYGTAEPIPDEETLDGGWAYAESPEITDEIKARFAKALEETDGVEYEPIANLGTQVVAGLNRCLLCKFSPVVPDPDEQYALVYVYEDLEGGASITDVLDFDFSEYCTYGL